MDKAATERRIYSEHRRGSLAAGLRSFFLRENSAETALSREKRALLKELEETLRDLRCARMNFERAYEPEMIEACIYEIKSAEARYDFLIRKAKQTGLSYSQLR